MEIFQMPCSEKLGGSDKANLPSSTSRTTGSFEGGGLAAGFVEDLAAGQRHDLSAIQQAQNCAVGQTAETGQLAQFLQWKFLEKKY